MSRLLRISLGMVFVAAAAGGLIWSYLAHRSELKIEEQGDQPIKNPTRVTQAATGEITVRFDRETQRRMDIRTEPLAAVTKRKEIAAYGHLEEDPARSFVLRSPSAGTIR